MRKLIRDNLSDIIPDDELEFVSGTEHERMLREKLYEELDELKDSDYKDVNEYGDVIEVLYALAETNGIKRESLHQARIKKLYERGGFKTGLILNRK